MGVMVFGRSFVVARKLRVIVTFGVSLHRGSIGLISGISIGPTSPSFNTC